MTTITQADRDAAASVAVLTEMRELILAGRADYHAEPFARHRAAGYAAGAVEGAKAMQWPDQWPLGTRVRKRKGSSWQGRVVGYYSTHLTPRGYAVESERETGSVQIYPKAALEVIDPAQIVGAKP